MNIKSHYYTFHGATNIANESTIVPTIKALICHIVATMVLFHSKFDSVQSVVNV